MKNNVLNKVIIASVLFISQVSFAGSGQIGSADLQNKSFCRTVISEGFFGQPAGKRQHCVSFSEDLVSDNADTFFGNPPEKFDFKVVEDRVVFGSSEYIISSDGLTLTTVKGSAVEGTVLTARGLKKATSAKGQSTRTVERGSRR